MPTNQGPSFKETGTWCNAARPSRTGGSVSVRHVEQRPLRLTLLEGQRKLPARLRHLASNGRNQLLASLDTCIEGDRIIHHPVQTAARPIILIDALHSRHLQHNSTLRFPGSSLLRGVEQRVFAGRRRIHSPAS